MRYASGNNIYASYLDFRSVDPLGLFDDKPPVPGAIGPDRSGCYTMPFDKLIDYISDGGKLPRDYLRTLNNGCVGIIRCGQIGGTCPDPGTVNQYPETAPQTFCYETQPSSDKGIPKAVSDAKCKEGEEKFIFAKQGLEHTGQCWPLGGDGFYEPGPFGPFVYPPVVGGGWPVKNGPDVADPRSGVYNYIWFVNGWYFWADRNNADGNGTVKICPNPVNDPKYPITMWCYTCKKLCKDSGYPQIPPPENPPPSK